MYTMCVMDVDAIAQVIADYVVATTQQLCTPIISRQTTQIYLVLHLVNNECLASGLLCRLERTKTACGTSIAGSGYLLRRHSRLGMFPFNLLEVFLFLLFASAVTMELIAKIAVGLLGRQ